LLLVKYHSYTLKNSVAKRPQDVAVKVTSCVAPWLPNTDVANIAYSTIYVG